MEITMNATFRPDLIEQTLQTFCDRLFNTSETKLILNIDPAGDMNVGGADAVLKVAQKFFGNNVTYRTPASACYADATRWCWKQVRGEYFFNLEDDFILLESISLARMVKIMELYPRLASLRFPKWETNQYTTRASKWEPLYEWNGHYYHRPQFDQRKPPVFCGVPSLLRASWAREVLPLLTKNNESFETQIVALRKQNVPQVRDWDYGCFSKPCERLIKDTGTDWRAQRKMLKDSRFHFITWVTK